MDKINEYRKEIDVIDNELMKLLERRFSLASLIAAEKKVCDLPILDAKREAIIFDKLEKSITNTLYKYEVIAIFEKIIAKSKEIQIGDK